MRTTSRGLRALTALTATVALGVAGLVATPASAYLEADGTADPSWHVDGPVYATVIVGNTVIVGGRFSHAVGAKGRTVGRTNLAAFSLSTGALKTSWRASVRGTVRAMVTDGVSLWVGGNLPLARGKGSRLVKIDVATGQVQPEFRAKANDTVYALALEGKDLYAGGSFTKVNKLWRARVAKLGAARGAVSRTFAARSSGTVYAVVPSPITSDLYLGGSFFKVGGQDHHAVAAVDGATGAVRSTLFRLTATTRGLDISPDGRLLYGATGGELNTAAAWSTRTGVRMFGVEADGPMRVVRYHAGTLYAGFSKGADGDTRVKLLAADAFNGTVDTGFQPRMPGFWGVQAIAATDAGVVLGGDFWRVNGAKARGMAVFRADLPPREEYVGGMSVWRYLDQGVRPDGWESEGFDDSLWGLGLPQLGYGDDDEETLIESGPTTSSYYWTSYYRTTFDVDALPTALTLLLAADDGAVVHVNGVEAARDNMPAGTIDNETHAPVWRGTTSEDRLRRFTIDPSLLHTGTNTLAVEVHQAQGGLVDSTFDARLLGVLAP